MIKYYYCNRNVSKRFWKPPMKECAKTLLANKSYCGGGLLAVKDNAMTQKEIDMIAEDYAVDSGKYENKNDCKNYRIRKLIPRECFRLMGVKDEDFDKVAPHQSDSSLYHLAGDSIVTDVLMAIFQQVL